MIGNFINAASGSGWFCQIPLTWTNPDISWDSYDVRTCWSIRARLNGTSTWTKMIKENGTTLSWITYVAPTHTNGVPDDMINRTHTNIDQGTSQRLIFDSTNYTNGIIPTDLK